MNCCTGGNGELYGYVRMLWWFVIQLEHQSNEVYKFVSASCFQNFVKETN